MKLLLDTHMCYWFAVRPDRLFPLERQAMNAATELAFSAVSIWEMRLKWERRHSSGERKGPVDPVDLLEALKLHGLRARSLTAEIAAVSLTVPLDHGDPFDQLLLTQAQQGGYRLLTRDKTLARHPLALAPA